MYKWNMCTKIDTFVYNCKLFKREKIKNVKNMDV